MNTKNNVLELIQEHVALFDQFEHVYLFGSGTNPSITHNDIDILIIYAKYSDNIENTLRIIKDELEKASGLLIDLTALSIQEERNVAFLERIKPNYVIIK